MPALPSYCKVITEEVPVTITGDTFAWNIPLTNLDDSVGDPTGYDRITAAMWFNDAPQGTLFDTEDNSIVPTSGNLLLIKAFAENTFPVGSYKMQIQFHFTFESVPWKQTYLHFEKLYVSGDVNPT